MMRASIRRRAKISAVRLPVLKRTCSMPCNTPIKSRQSMVVSFRNSSNKTKVFCSACSLSTSLTKIAHATELSRFNIAAALRTPKGKSLKKPLNGKSANHLSLVHLCENIPSQGFNPTVNGVSSSNTIRRTKPNPLWFSLFVVSMMLMVGVTQCHYLSSPQLSDLRTVQSINPTQSSILSTPLYDTLFQTQMLRNLSISDSPSNNDATEIDRVRKVRSLKQVIPKLIRAVGMFPKALHLRAQSPGRKRTDKNSALRKARSQNQTLALASQTSTLRYPPIPTELNNSLNESVKEDQIRDQTEKKLRELIQGNQPAEIEVMVIESDLHRASLAKTPNPKPDLAITNPYNRLVHHLSGKARAKRSILPMFDSRIKTDFAAKCSVLDFSLFQVDQNLLVSVKGTISCDSQLITFCDAQDDDHTVGSCVFHGKICRTFIPNIGCEHIRICNRPEFETSADSCRSFVQRYFPSLITYRWFYVALLVLLIFLVLSYRCASPFPLSWYFIRGDVNDNFRQFLDTIKAVNKPAATAGLFSQLPTGVAAASDTDSDAGLVVAIILFSILMVIYLIMRANEHPIKTLKRVYNRGGRDADPSVDATPIVENDALDETTQDQAAEEIVKLDDKPAPIKRRSVSNGVVLTAICFILALCTGQALSIRCKDFTNTVELDRDCVEDVDAPFTHAGKTRCFVIEGDPVCVCKPGTYGELCDKIVTPFILGSNESYLLAPYGLSKTPVDYHKGCLSGKYHFVSAYPKSTSGIFENCIPRSNNLNTFNPDYHESCNDLFVADEKFYDPICQSGAELYPILGMDTNALDKDHVMTANNAVYYTTLHYGKTNISNGISGIDVYLNDTFASMSLCTSDHPDLLVIVKEEPQPDHYVSNTMKNLRSQACADKTEIHRWPALANKMYYKTDVYCTNLPSTPHRKFMTATNRLGPNLNVESSSECRLGFYRGVYSGYGFKPYHDNGSAKLNSVASMALHLGERWSTIGPMADASTQLFLFRNNYFYFQPMPVQPEFFFVEGDFHYGFVGLIIPPMSCKHMAYLLEMLPPTTFKQFFRDSQFDEDPDNDKCHYSALYETTFPLTFHFGISGSRTFSFSTEKHWSKFSQIECTATNVPVHHDSIHFFGRCFSPLLHALTDCNSVSIYHDKDQFPNGDIQPIYRCEQLQMSCSVTKNGSNFLVAYDSYLQLNGRMESEIPAMDPHTCKPQTVVCGDQHITTYICGDICKHNDFIRMYAFFPITPIFGRVSEYHCRLIYARRATMMALLLAFHLLLTMFTLALISDIFYLLFRGLLFEYLSRWIYAFQLWGKRRFCNRCLNMYSWETYQLHRPYCHLIFRGKVGSYVNKDGAPLTPKNDRVFFYTEYYDCKVPATNDRPYWFIRLMSKTINWPVIGQFTYWHILHRRVVTKYFPFFPCTIVFYFLMMSWCLTFGAVLAADSHHKVTSDVIPAHPYVPINPVLQYIQAEACTNTAGKVTCGHVIELKQDTADYSKILHFSLGSSESKELIKMTYELEENFIEYETVLEYCTSSFNFTYLGRRTCYGVTNEASRCSWEAHFEGDDCTPLVNRLPPEYRQCQFDEICDLNWWSDAFNACGCAGFNVVLPWTSDGSELLRRYWHPDFSDGYSCIYKISSIKPHLKLCLTLNTERRCSYWNSARMTFSFSVGTVSVDLTSPVSTGTAPHSRVGLRFHYGSSKPPEPFVADDWLPYSESVYGAPGDFQMQGIGKPENGLCVQDTRKPEATFDCDLAASSCWTYTDSACLTKSRDPSIYNCRSPGRSGYQQAVADPQAFFVNNDELWYAGLTSIQGNNASRPKAQFFGRVINSGNFMDVSINTAELKFNADTTEISIELREPVKCYGQYSSMVHILCNVTVFNPSKDSITESFHTSTRDLILHHRSYNLRPGVNKITIRVSGHDVITDFDICPDLYDGNCATFHGRIDKEYVHNVTTNHDAFDMWGSFEGFKSEVTTFSIHAILFWIAMVLLLIAVLASIYEIVSCLCIRDAAPAIFAKSVLDSQTRESRKPILRRPQRQVHFKSY